MYIIAVVNTKGGVGKTTIASALAVRAAKDSPRVAMVDLDPQRSLVEWWDRRGAVDNPTVFEGAASPANAVEALALDGWDWVFLDGPPALLLCMEQALSVATFAIVPARASLVDLMATTDVLAMAEAAGVPHLMVLNAVPSSGKSGDQARAMLIRQKTPVAETIVHQRQSYVAGLNAGKSAAEVNAGRDKAAASEIDALWSEVKAATIAAAKKKARRRR